MDRDFWQGLYASGDTRFDLGGPVPALLDWLAATAPAPGKAVVPGCGRGYDVNELARRGWDALGVDLAPTAIRDARSGGAGRFLEADFFTVPPEPCDLFFENTFYCAIAPSRRDEYARAAARWVVPGGTLLFVAFPVGAHEGGPPFAIAADELAPRFAANFTLEALTQPRPSLPRRAGREWLAVFRRKVVSP